jgi:hypothetical protein
MPTKSSLAEPGSVKRDDTKTHVYITIPTRTRISVRTIDPIDSTKLFGFQKKSTQRR